MSLTILNPNVHLVKETPASRFFQRRLNSPDPMTFWSSQTGQWILALWIHRPKHIVEEIEDLGPAFEYLTPTFVKMIVRAYGPVDFGKKKKLILSRHLDRLRKMDDTVLEDQDRWNWLRKRTKDEMALPYAFDASMSGGGVL